MIIMGVDLGKVRTGISICDESEFLASPLTVIEESNSEKLISKIVSLVQLHHAGEIVVGLPKNMDGSEGESAQNARKLGKKLEEKTGLKTAFFDERGTTVTAHGYLNTTNTRGKKRKAVVDAVAATIILQDYLDFRKNKNG